jgi:hypothetical protein
MENIDGAMKRNAVIGCRDGLLFALNVAAEQVAQLESMIKTLAEREGADNNA